MTPYRQSKQATVGDVKERDSDLIVPFKIESPGQEIRENWSHITKTMGSLGLALHGSTSHCLGFHAFLSLSLNLTLPPFLPSDCRLRRLFSAQNRSLVRETRPLLRPACAASPSLERLTDRNRSFYAVGFKGVCRSLSRHEAACLVPRDCKQEQEICSSRQG